MIVKKTFANGGFVLHKVLHGRCKYSAWYDADGRIQDAEGFDRFGRGRSVKRDGPVWQHLSGLGAVWK